MEEFSFEYVCGMYKIKDALPSGMGKLVFAEIAAPGVWNIRLLHNNEQWAREYYVAWDDSPVLSREARAQGTRLEKLPGLLFDLNGNDGIKAVLRYEICRYKVREDGEWKRGELKKLARWGSECAPEYFGNLPIPAMTRWGVPLRAQTLDNGLYRLETAEGSNILAAYYPKWLCVHEEIYLKLSVKDLLADGEGDPEGCLLFSEQDSCVALYELLCGESGKGALLERVDLPGLMRAVQERHPEYAESYFTVEELKKRRLYQPLCQQCRGRCDVPRSGPVRMPEEMEAEF